MITFWSELMAHKGAKAQSFSSFAPLRLCARISSLLFICLILGVEMIVAQSEVGAQMTAVQPVAHIGEAVDLVVTVAHPAGWRVIAPQIEQEWGDFEVREQSPIMVTTTGAGESSQFTLTVMTWAFGEFSTPELTLTVANEAGELVEVTAVPVTIQVESVLTEADLELRDIKPQATLPLPVWWPWLAGIRCVATRWCCAVVAA